MQLLVGLLMGMAFVATPGPVNVETIRCGLSGGFPAAFTLQLGSNLGRLIYGLLALAGAGLFIYKANMQLMLGLTGTAVLFYLGLSSIRGWHAPNFQDCLASKKSDSGGRVFLAGLLISLMNPLAIIFWLSIGSRYMGQPGCGGAEFLIGFIAGCFFISFFIALFASYWQDYLTPKLAQSISFVCGLGHIVFGLKIAFFTFL